MKPKSGMNGRKKQGSILLLTLFVVSLLMVITLAFAVWVRMEIRAVQNAIQLHKARANARLSVEMAVAKLQELSGADTRVTAPTLLSSTNVPNQRLIGRVVDAGPFVREDSGLVLNPDYSQTIGYLISHSNEEVFDPLSYDPFDDDMEASAGHALLVGEGSVSDASDYVAAPMQSVIDPAGGTSGGYAFWIRDESLLAQINLTDTNRVDGVTNAREQVLTTQRNASERVLPNYDPNRDVHQQILNRVIVGDQLALTPFPGALTPRNLFHDITMRSQGLPTNPKRGGLKRDLTAVMMEAWTNTAEPGRVPTDGEQYTALLDFQSNRLERWREETLALEALGSQPDWMSDTRWNALHGLTVRADQSVPAYADKLFPPNTDISVKYDQGSGSWRQLITYGTMRRHSWDGTDEHVISRKRSEALNTALPVIAKYNMFHYFTMDYPMVRMHMIPSVVLWNPYTEPIGLDVAAGGQWGLSLEYDNVLWEGNRLRFKVKNDHWRGGQELWTKSFQMRYTHTTQNGYRGQNGKTRYWLTLHEADGGNDVIIPPGEAVIFSLHEHMDVPFVDSDVPQHFGRVDPNQAIPLRAGLHDSGGYSFYIQENFHDWVIYDSTNTRSGYDLNGAGGVNSWDRTRDRNGLTHYPFPMSPNDVPGCANAVDPALEHIAVTRNGLDPAHGWEFLDCAMELGQESTGGTTLASTGVALFGGASPDLDRTSDAWAILGEVHSELPYALYDANPWDNPNLLPVFGGPPPSFPQNGGEPFSADSTSYPAFPGWGMSWGLRLPDNSFNFNDPGHGVGAYFTSPSRWLADYNPTVHYPSRSPICRSFGRNSRKGYGSLAAVLGGFIVEDADYFDLTDTTPNDRNQYIGHSDDLTLSGAPGTKLALYDIPESPMDLVSIASFAHANLLPVAHPHTRYNMQHYGVDVAANQPVYPIGNSMAHVLVPRDRTTKSFYLSPAQHQATGGDHPSTGFEPGIPYLESGSPRDYGGGYGAGSGYQIAYYPGQDASWLYNEVLWDDFLLTSDYNQRIQWTRVGGSANRDFTKSCEHLYISGAFNVNSISVAAWATLLESMLDIDVGNQSGNGEVNADQRVPFSRFVEPLAEAFDGDGDFYDTPTTYSGYRRLTRDDIWDQENNTGLAVEIVEQVKLRGPFLSLADFVNRALVPASHDTNETGKMGAVQAAIQNSGINERLGVVTDTDVWLREGDDFPGLWEDPRQGGLPGASRWFGMHLENAEGTMAAGAPGYLMQSDVLSKIGSVLQVRSDTFMIRAYGSSGGSSDDPAARVWCEVLVQRTADFVDPTNAPGDTSDTLTELNASFGRQYKILSFRWLEPEEI